MKKGKNKSHLVIFLIIIIILVSSVMVWFSRSNKNTSNKPLNQIVKSIINPSPIDNSSKMLSGDGAMTLIMKIANQPDKTKLYSYSALNNSNNSEQLIFTKSVDALTSFSIPGNTWSPDNKYVFISEKSTLGITFLVLKVSGEVFTNGQQYLDIGSLFVQKQPKFTMTDVTGWASPNLLVLTTNNEQGTKGSSFWFDVLSSSFIQLAR